MYADVEAKLMARMRTHNKGRFRTIALCTVLGTIWVFNTFGSEIRKFVGGQTAEVARETLRHESLQIQTQELATAVVNTLLNDPEVLSGTSLFLQMAAVNPETQASAAAASRRQLPCVHAYALCAAAGALLCSTCCRSRFGTMVACSDAASLQPRLGSRCSRACWQSGSAWTAVSNNGYSCRGRCACLAQQLRLQQRLSLLCCIGTRLYRQPL